MQTLERPTGEERPSSGRRAPKLSTPLAIAGGLLLVPVLAALVLTRWGVLAAVLLAMVAGLALFVIRRGFAFYQLVGFLIHFDGLGAGPIRLGRGLALVAFVLLAYKLYVEKWRPPAIPARHWLPPLTLVILVVASGAWSASTPDWAFTIGLIGLAVAFYLVAALLVDSHEKMLKFMRAFWIGGLFGAGAGVLGLALGTRSWGFGGDPNGFGVLMASVIPLTVYYRRQAVTQRERWWYTAALVFVVAGAAGAGSRTGVIASSLTIVATIITKPGLNSGQRAKSFVTAAVAGALAFVVLFVANPNNLARGFNDRGAGRLDLWTASLSLIQDRPILGHGAGQLSIKIPDRLAVTPDVQSTVEAGDREKVSAHNTWLDLVGDFGIAGFLIWLWLIVVTIVSFIRPRWRRTKELSTTLLVMMVPVIVGSMLLPMANKKLPWTLFGLAAALQVASWSTRWRGYAASGSLDLETARSGHASPVDGSSDDEPELARWDVKVSRRFRKLILAGAAVGFTVVFVVMSSLPVKHTVTTGVMFAERKAFATGQGIQIPQERLQGTLTLVASAAYAAELQRLSGVDLGIREIERRISVRRPEAGGFVEIKYSDSDEARAEQVAPYLITALDAVVAGSREYGLAGTQDEFRPVIPGEQRFSTEPLYIPAFQQGTLGIELQRTAFASLVGAATGALIMFGYVLLQQRRPRVNNGDDLPRVLGLPLWAHVGHAGRRFAADRDQYLQVVGMAGEATEPDREPRRIVIASPGPDAAVRGLAMGVAGAVASTGRRVVLVDAQLERPLLSLRLGGFGRAGLRDVAEGRRPLATVLRRVNRWRFPTGVRRMLKGHADLVRFVPAGRLRRSTVEVRPRVLDAIDPEAVLVVLAPSLLGTTAAAPAMVWSDALVLGLVEGRTVTFDAEDAAARIQTFVRDGAGVVLLDA